MNKFKRLCLFFRHKFLRLERFFGNSFYVKRSYKYFKDCGVVFPNGKPKYINYDVDFDLLGPGMIYVGKNTVIAKGSIILTHDFSIECGLIAVNKTKPGQEAMFLKEVHIGDNTFIGARTFILPGAKIGNNVIIGAGSVVSGTIPDNVVAAGNPCKVICSIEEWANRKIEKGDFIYPGNKKK